MMSLPLPRVMVFAPDPPNTMSLPLPSVIALALALFSDSDGSWLTISERTPPAHVISPSSPSTILLPLPPVILSKPVPATMMSLPSPVMIVSAPPAPGSVLPTFDRCWIQPSGLVKKT